MIKKLIFYVIFIICNYANPLAPQLYVFMSLAKALNYTLLFVVISKTKTLKIVSILKNKMIKKCINYII